MRVHYSTGCEGLKTLAIDISLDNGRDDERWRTVLVKSQNCQVIPRSNTCNLLNETIRYKLHTVMILTRKMKIIQVIIHGRYSLSSEPERVTNNFIQSKSNVETFNRKLMSGCNCRITLRMPRTRHLTRSIPY